jgi:hypothetical protein
MQQENEGLSHMELELSEYRRAALRSDTIACTPSRRREILPNEPALESLKKAQQRAAENTFGLYV